MKRSHALTFFGFAAVVALGCALALRGEVADTPDTEPRGKLPEAKFEALRSSDSMPTVVSVPSMKDTVEKDHRGPSSKLASELMRSTDWRSFAITARARPSEGGIFYAKYVTNLCGSTIAGDPHVASKAARKAAANSGTVAPVLMAMAEKFAARCASFAAGEASAMAADLGTVNAKSDPLLAATADMTEAMKSKDATRLRVALTGLLALNDPIVLDDRNMLASVLSVSAGKVDRSPGDIWFEGVAYKLEDVESRDTFNLAIKLASCTGASPCELHQWMMLSCLGGHACSDDPADFLRQRFVQSGKMSDKQFSELIALKDRLRQAISSGNVEAFLH